MDPASQFANAYAYAGNGANPVIMVDEDGNFISLALALIGASAAISGTVTATKVYKSTGGDWGKAIGGFIIGAGAGALGGTLGAMTGGATMPWFAGALGSFSTTFSGGLVSATLAGIAGGAVGGAASGLAGGFLTTGLVTGNFEAAMRSGLIGMINGIGTGAIVGGLSGAAGYSIGRGIEALKYANSTGKLTNTLSKSAQKINVKAANDISSASADKALDLSIKPPIEDPMKPMPKPEIYDIKKYYKITNPTSQAQPPVLKLPVQPIQIPTTQIQMSPVNINPLPQGVTSVGNGSYYMITPSADYFYHNTSF